MHTIILGESACCPIPRISLSVIKTSATVYLLITHPAIYLFFTPTFLPIHLHKPKHGPTQPPAYPSCAQPVTRLSSHCTVPYLPTPAPTCLPLDPPTQSKEPSIHPFYPPMFTTLLLLHTLELISPPSTFHMAETCLTPMNQQRLWNVELSGGDTV